MTKKNDRLDKEQEMFYIPAMGSTSRSLIESHAIGTLGSILPDVAPEEIMVDKGYPGYRTIALGAGRFNIESTARKLLDPNVRSRISSELTSGDFMDNVLETVLPTKDSRLERGVKVFNVETAKEMISRRGSHGKIEAGILADILCHAVSEFGIVGPSYEKIEVESRYNNLHPTLEDIRRDTSIRALMDLLDAAKVTLALKVEKRMYYAAAKGLLTQPLRSLGRKLISALQANEYNLQTALYLVHQRVTNNDEFFTLNSTVKDDSSLMGLASNLSFVRASFEYMNTDSPSGPVLSPLEWKNALSAVYLSTKQSVQYDTISLVEHAARYTHVVMKDCEGVRKMLITAKNLAAENRNQVTHFYPTGDDDNNFQEPNIALETKLDSAMSGLAPRLHTSANVQQIETLCSHLIEGIEKPTLLSMNMDSEEMAVLAAAKADEVYYSWRGVSDDRMEFNLLYEYPVAGPVGPFDQNVINGRLSTLDPVELLLYTPDAIDGPCFPARVQSIPEEDRGHALVTPYKALAIRFDRPITILLQGSGKETHSVKLDLAELFGVPIWNAGVIDTHISDPSGDSDAERDAMRLPGMTPYVTVNPVNLALINSFFQALGHVEAMIKISTDEDVKELKYQIHANIGQAVVSLLETIYDTPMGEAMERAIHRRLIMDQPDLPSKLRVKSDLRLNKMFEMGRVNIALALLIRTGVMNHADMRNAIEMITKGRLWGTLGRSSRT